MEQLMRDGLRGPRDPFDEHLLPQLERIKQKLYIHDDDHAIDILSFGYSVDTDLQNGVGIGELTLRIANDLAEIAETVLQKDFPNISRDAVELVVGRTIDLYTGDKMFIDAFIDAIDERRAIMNTLPRSTYVLDESTGIVEQKKK